MNDLLDAILFAMGVTLPSVLLLGFGVVLRRLGQVDSAFVATASRLVFNYALPCLLFTQLMGSTIRYGEEARMLAAGLTTALGLFLASELYAWRFVPDVRDRGVFVQGVFRSNMAIMGLAFVQNAYGDAGLPSGAVYVGVVTLLYNVLSVITLSRAQARSGRHRLLDIGRNILTNPLIVSILLAMLLQRLCGGVVRCPLGAGPVGHFAAGEHRPAGGGAAGGRGGGAGLWPARHSDGRAVPDVCHAGGFGQLRDGTQHGRQPRGGRQYRGYYHLRRHVLGGTGHYGTAFDGVDVAGLLSDGSVARRFGPA